MGVVCPLLALNGTITHRPLVCLMFVAQMNPCLFCVSPRTWTNVCHCRLTSESLTATWRSYSSAVRPSTSRSVDALVELRWSVCVFLIIMLDRKMWFLPNIRLSDQGQISLLSGYKFVYETTCGFSQSSSSCQCFLWVCSLFCVCVCVCCYDVVVFNLRIQGP